MNSSMDPSRMGAREMRDEIAAERLTAVAVAHACRARIAEREPAIGAWARLDRDKVFAAARALDLTTRRGPLHGVPIGVKDLIDTADLPTEYGSPIYRGHRPSADAAPVALARAAGALVLGKTVTTEFATIIRARPQIRMTRCARRAAHRAVRPRRCPTAWYHSPSARRPRDQSSGRRRTAA
jgi:Asp-tRNA(Asn)/Glu-tRNA(Gln) amidotransferase A subunit family amidase